MNNVSNVGNGGGIAISGRHDLDLYENVLIANNIANNWGGGILLILRCIQFAPFYARNNYNNTSQTRWWYVF